MVSQSNHERALSQRAARLRFGRDGRWYADDEPIEHPRISRFLSRHLVRRPDGSYWVESGDERAPVVVDDTPVVVQDIDRGPDGALLVALSDGTSEPLATGTLVVGAGDVLYCRVKSGCVRARFLRPAYHRLARFIEEPAPGRFVLRDGAVETPIARE